jgi:hypothetical protein
MNFSDLVETSTAVALASKLYPDEAAIWLRYCRSYSKLFYTPLLQVMDLNPEFVITQVMSDQLAEWDVEERMEDLLDIIGGLKDPEYDAKRERAIRESDQKMEEEERQRLKEGKAVHKSLEKDKRVITKEKPAAPKKELPKSGGINMNLIKQLQNDEKESGEF